MRALSSLFLSSKAATSRRVVLATLDFFCCKRRSRSRESLSWTRARAGCHAAGGGIFQSVELRVACPVLPRALAGLVDDDGEDDGGVDAAGGLALAGAAGERRRVRAFTVGSCILEVSCTLEFGASGRCSRSR